MLINHTNTNTNAAQSYEYQCWSIIRIPMLLNHTNPNATQSYEYQCYSTIRILIPILLNHTNTNADQSYEYESQCRMEWASDAASRRDAESAAELSIDETITWRRTIGFGRQIYVDKGRTAKLCICEQEDRERDELVAVLSSLFNPSQSGKHQAVLIDIRRWLALTCLCTL